MPYDIDDLEDLEEDVLSAFLKKPLPEGTKHDSKAAHVRDREVCDICFAKKVECSHISLSKARFEVGEIIPSVLAHVRRG